MRCFFLLIRMQNFDQELCESMFRGSTGCQPVLLGSLPKRNVVGKLPTTAGKLQKVTLRYSFTVLLTNPLPRKVNRQG